MHAAGDVKTAFANAAKVYKAEFKSDFAYHAQMEPLNAVARMNEAATASKSGKAPRRPTSRARRWPRPSASKEEQVTHNQCYLGGGFGRRNGGYEAVEAALIAREVKRPVKLVWTREEDVAQGRFRPQSFQCLEAGTRCARQGHRLEACVTVSTAAMRC